MRPLAVAGVGVLLAALLVVAGVEAMRARLESNPRLRAGVERAASAQLGAELRGQGLRVELWPARLRILEPSVELPGDARLVVEAVELDVGLGELLRGVARLQSASAGGAARLESPRLTLPGRVKLTLRPDAETGAWRAEGDLSLDSGGRAVVQGRIGPAALFEGSLRFEEIEAAPFAALVETEPGRPAAFEGRFSGTLDPPSEKRHATLRLASERARIEIPPLVLDGPVELVAEIPRLEPGAVPTGFAIDASQARVEYAGGFTQATGDGASVEGRIVRRPDGRLQLEQVALKVVGFQGEHRR